MILLSLLLAVAPVGGIGASLDGIWVPSSLKQALETGQAGEMPCWVRVDGSAGPSISEDCGGQVRDWTDVVPAVQRAGTLEVEGRVEGGGRRLVLRAGAPNELERIVLSDDGAPKEVQRLYRTAPGSEARLAGWSAAHRLLVHPFRTDDGARIEFRADGSYRFAEETGRYDMELWPLVEGAAGLLILSPSEGQQKPYWVVGGEERLGLVPGPQPYELEKLRTLRDRALAAQAIEPPPPEPEPEPMEAVEETERALDAMIERVRGGAGADPVPAVATRQQEGGAEPEPVGSRDDTLQAPGLPAILTVSLDEVSVWLVKDEPQARKDPPAAVLELEPEPQEIPAIAQPITPKRKSCGGCDTAGGAGLLALLPLLGLAAHKPGRKDRR